MHKAYDKNTTPVFKMNAFQKNDSIILKGTNFKSKPLFATFTYPEFDKLVRHLKLEYGKTITNGQPIKGKEELNWDDGFSLRSRPVPIPLQPYHFPFYNSMLLVVGSDESDTIVLTSPMAENVRKYFGFSRWSRKPERYGFMLQAMERDNCFVALTYSCTAVSLQKDWYKTVRLRKRDTVQLYVVPKPLEYFPMLFINCSMDNIRNLYDNITALMISNYPPVDYSPSLFTYIIFRPILFNIVDNRIEYRQRLPGIDLTDEEFVKRRTECLLGEDRRMVSDCKCRSNTEVLPSATLRETCGWHRIDHLYRHYCGMLRSDSPPLYTQIHSDCNGDCDMVEK